MAYMSCMGPCVGCRRVFSFNPDRVPSLRVDGYKQPVCRDCMAKVNVERKEKGLEPFPVQPGAYEAEEVP
jgi:hypothetical protein